MQTLFCHSFAGIFSSRRTEGDLMGISDFCGLHTRKKWHWRQQAVFCEGENMSSKSSANLNLDIEFYLFHFEKVINEISLFKFIFIRCGVLFWEPNGKISLNNLIKPRTSGMEMGRNFKEMFLFISVLIGRPGRKDEINRNYIFSHNWNISVRCCRAGNTASDTMGEGSQLSHPRPKWINCFCFETIKLYKRNIIISI